jgi:hypothetical protein
MQPSIKDRPDLEDWKIGKRIAEALKLPRLSGDGEKYKTAAWGTCSPIKLTRVLRRIL